MKVGKLEDGDRGVVTAQHRRFSYRADCGNPLSFRWISGLLPGCPTTLKCRDMDQALFHGCKRRTGALVLGLSGTIENDQFVFWQLGVPLPHLVHGYGDSSTDVLPLVGRSGSNIHEQDFTRIG